MHSEFRDPRRSHITPGVALVYGLGAEKQCTQHTIAKKQGLDKVDINEQLTLIKNHKILKNILSF